MPEVDIESVRHLIRALDWLSRQLKSNLKRCTSPDPIEKLLAWRAHEQLLRAERCHDNMAAESSTPDGHDNVYKLYGELALGNPKRGGDPGPTRDAKLNQRLPEQDSQRAGLEIIRAGDQPRDEQIRSACSAIEYAASRPSSTEAWQHAMLLLWRLRVGRTDADGDSPFVADAKGVRRSGTKASKKTQQWAEAVCKALQKTTPRQTASGLAVKVVADTAEIDVRHVRRLRGRRRLDTRGNELLLALAESTDITPPFR